MSCEHVLGAIAGRAHLSSDAVVEFAVDLGDDGSMVLPYVVCPACAAHFGLRAGMVLSGESIDRVEMPSVVPSCLGCFAVWRGSPC